jgi:glycosyltransferase involved in cell wall biosynthesis
MRSADGASQPSGGDDGRVKLVAFTDYVYHKIGGRVYAERAFALFLAALADQVTELTIVGRLAPEEGPSHYMLPPSVRFVALPHYANLTQPLAVGGSLVRSLYRFWRTLDDADSVWLLGPYPHALAFALIAHLRRRRLVLGVRQDFPTYIRARRPNQRWVHRAADVLELAWRTLARSAPVVVVGPELARHYRHSPELLEITVSLISSADVAAGESAARRSYDGELDVLSVGRIDREKNPLLLADVLAQLQRNDPRWRLVVCGEGPLTPALLQRLEELGLSDHAELLGYVPIDGGLLERYRSSHVFLHVSLTEGMPQVLTEAFASGVPVVATAVGGVPDAAGDAALLVPPGDAEAAANAVQRIAQDAGLRNRLVATGLARARSQTYEAEVARVAAFVSGGSKSVVSESKAGSVAQ